MKRLLKQNFFTYSIKKEIQNVKNHIINLEESKELHYVQSLPDMPRKDFLKQNFEGNNNKKQNL
jgi:hypothetical protein